MAIKVSTKKFEVHRGVNDQLPNIKKIEDDHLVELTNFNYVPASENSVHLHEREGTTKDVLATNLTGGTVIQGLNFTEFTGGTETIFAYDDKLYRQVALSGTSPQIMLSGVSDKMHDFAMLEDRLIIANGTDVLREMAYQGTPSTLAGSPPVGRFLHTWHNFVFTAGISGSLTTLRWSALGDKDTWPAANQQDQPHGEITGIGSLGNVFYIFFKNKIRTLIGYTTGDFVFQDFRDIGCVSHYGIVSNGTTLFFPASDGIYAIGQLGSTANVVGGSSLIKLSPEKIKTFWDDLDNSELQLIHGVNDPFHHSVRFSCRRQSESDNDRELVYDYHENVLGFRFMKGRYPQCYSLGKDSNGTYQVKYGDARTGATTGGMLYKLDESGVTDDGIVITGVIIPKAYDFDKPDVNKYFINIDFLAKGVTSETQLKVNYGVGDYPSTDTTKTIITPTLPLWGTAIWGVDKYESDTFKNYPIAIRRTGKALVGKFVSDVSGKKIQIAGWTINSQVFKKSIESDT